METSMNIKEFMFNNRKLEITYAQSFRNLFGINLHDYMDYVTGFDIVKFDDWLGTPENVSTKDYLEQKYGKIGVDLIRTLI